MPALATLRRWILVLAAGLTALSARAQRAGNELAHCLLLPLDAAQRARVATLVVEAEVLSQRGFWDAARRHIYTASTLRVYKLLKGQWAPGIPLTVVTEGGTVGDARETLTNTLRLTPGQQGLLFLVPAAFPDVAEPAAWAAYASQQGFIRYEVATASAAEPFRRYPLVDEQFYQQQAALTGQGLRELAPNPALTAALARRRQPAAARGGDAPLITSFAPRSIAAGADSVLTITGTGFGSARGSVQFPNADDGGASFVSVAARDIVSWTDTRIEVRVPSYASNGDPAGSGRFRVLTADQLPAQSLTELTVRYALTNVEESTTNITYRPVLFNQNGSGGYTFRPDAAFAQNQAAMASFGRALSSWRCQTAINWDLGAARPSRGVASDDVNALEFDQGGQLPTNVLGRTTSYYVGCRDAGGGIRFWVKEIDMQYDDAVNWQFGPAAPGSTQFDFETVALHELGHGQQLSHVIAPQLVMHFAIGRGQQARQLNPARDVRGGYAVQLLSVAPPACGPAPELPAPLTAAPGAQTQGGAVLLSWPTANECGGTLFLVERSPDARTWTRLGQVAATGAGSYRYTDAQAPAGLNYYRLQVQLANGLALPTAPVGVRSDGSGPALAVFPNPTTSGLVSLEYNAPAASNALEVRIYDALGRYCGGQRLQVTQAGINVLTLALPELRAGWYVLRWTDGGQSGSAPFLRLR